MDFFNIFFSIYVNLIRAILIFLSIYHILKRDFKLMRITIIVFTLTFFVMLLDKTLHIKVGLLGSFLYITIIFMALYFGSGLKFYDKYAWWDRVIHFMSGIAAVCFGIAISNKVQELNKFNRLFFSLTFSISINVIWEVLEYVVDCIFHTNHQRWQKTSDSNNHISQSAIQPAGLVDTMNDIIIGIIGTLVICVVWWFVL